MSRYGDNSSRRANTDRVVGRDGVLLDDIPTACDFTTAKFVGRWYARKINLHANQNQQAVHPVAVELYRGRGDLVYHRTLLRVPEIDDYIVNEALMSPSCGENVGEFHLSDTSADSHGRWYAYKVLTLTDTVLTTMMCVKETVGGTCHQTGLHGCVWTRQPDQPIADVDNLLELYSEFGFDNNNWEPVTDLTYDETVLDAPKYVDNSGRSLECQAMNVPTVSSFCFPGVFGYWYTIATAGTFSTASHRSTGDFRGAIDERIAGLNSSGQCEERLHMLWRPRCSSGPDFGYMGRIEREELWSFGIFKVLYSDGNTVMVYVCPEVDHDGYCIPNTEKINIFSRTPTLEPTMRAQLNDTMLTACVDPNRIIDTDQSKDCTFVLR
ncbi:hypothetical protein ScPMuIL_012774 [Solemya velum]